MTEHEEVIGRLDVLIGTMQLAFADQLEQARSVIRSDVANTAILDGSENWIGAGALKKVAMDAGEISQATAERRIADLVERRALIQVGAGSATKYRSTGLL